MRAPSTWRTSKKTSLTMMSPTKPWRQRRECRKAKPQASRLRFALVWILAPTEEGREGQSLTSSKSGDFIDRHFARDALERRALRARGDAAILQQHQRLRIVDDRLAGEDRVRNREPLNAGRDIHGLTEVVQPVVEHDREAWPLVD